MFFTLHFYWRQSGYRQQYPLFYWVSYSIGFECLVLLQGIIVTFHIVPLKLRDSFAFVLSCFALAQSSAQRGVIWWASNHRHHHRFSDQKDDLHSPVTDTLLHAHVGWLWDKRSYEYRKNATDLERVPELVWLNRYPMVPAFVLALGCFFTFDWSGLVYGFWYINHCVVSWNIYHQFIDPCLG